MKMENGLDIRKVPFMGSELMAAKDKDGQVWAGISYICNGIGLSKHQKDRQVAIVQTDDTLKEGCLKFEAGSCRCGWRRSVSPMTIAMRP